jgi:hypothetical protein
MPLVQVKGASVQYSVGLSRKLRVLRVLHPPPIARAVYTSYNKHPQATPPYRGGFASPTWGRAYATEFNG